MARKLGLDGQAVAYGVLEALLGESALDGCWLGGGTSQSIVAHHLLEAADHEYQPRARKLILTFDLAEPDDPWKPPGVQQPATAEYVDDEPVPYVPAEDEAVSP